MEERKTEKENIFLVKVKKKREGKGGKYLEKEKIFIWRRRNTEKEKEENIMKKEKLAPESKAPKEVFADIKRHTSVHPCKIDCCIPLGLTKLWRMHTASEYILI